MVNEFTENRFEPEPKCTSFLLDNLIFIILIIYLFNQTVVSTKRLKIYVIESRRSVMFVQVFEKNSS